MTEMEDAAMIIARAITQVGFSSNDETVAGALDNIKLRLQVSDLYNERGIVLNITDAINRGASALEDIGEQLLRIADVLETQQEEKGN